MLNEYSDCIEFRGGLPNSSNALSAGNKVEVLFFGGSVTAGYGATDIEKTSWRARTGEWLKQNFQTSDITCHSKALGESGTFMGCLRIERILDEISPDLMFLEYSINDYYDDASFIRASSQFETIVRTVKTRYPKCDIATVLVTDQRLAEKAKLGIMHAQAEAHDAISAHYGIPSLKVGCALAKRIDLDCWNDYFKDIVHPFDSAHEKYFGCIKEFLANALLFSSYDSDNVCDLPPILSREPFIKRQITDISESFFINSGQKGFCYSGDTKFEFKGKMTADSPSAEFTYTFFGTDTAIYTNKIGDEAPSAQIDGKPHFPAISRALAHNPLKIASNLSEGLHTVKITTNSPDTEIYAIFSG